MSFLPLVLKYNAAVLALGLDDRGVPTTTDDPLRVGRKLVNDLKDSGVVSSDIYLDSLVQLLATNDRAGIELLEAIRVIKQGYPEIHLICGLSNISFGFPSRKILNRVFIIQTMSMGVDSYILDPLNKVLVIDFYAPQTLLGRDKFCKNCLTKYRRGLI